MIDAGTDDVESESTPDAVISAEIGSEKLAEAERRRAVELAALYAVSAAMNQAPSDEQALAQALARVVEVLRLESGRIYLFDPKQQRLSLVAAEGNPDFLDPPEKTIGSGECLCGLALLSEAPLLAVDAALDSRIVLPGCRHHSQHPCLAVPLLAKDRTLGVLHVIGGQGVNFSHGDVALLRSVGAQIGVCMENMRLREEARRAEELSTLIAEMHHRIKNNLQTVADLISLEMFATSSPEARRSLRDSINRIKSIAAVHQLLSLEQLRLTDITQLARQVCSISLGQLASPRKRVEVRIHGDAIYLPSKQATALALVINELVANAGEHAFDDDRQAVLSITIAQEDAQVSISVVDDGRGFPPGFELERDSGLGLQIVRTLVEKDLAGTLRLDSAPDAGSRITLTFYR